MKCPYCGWHEDKVVDSREVKEGASIRRRRECTQCTRRFTSHERIDEIRCFVVKKGESREPFDRDKVLAGLRHACWKRPIAPRQLEELSDELEIAVQSTPDKEMSSLDLGKLIMERLRTIDQVAYVRFASVYRSFEDVGDFVEEVRDLLEQD